METRRKFLRKCSVVSAVALVAPPVVLAEHSLSTPRQTSLDELTLEDLTGQLHTAFRIHASPEHSILLKLDEIKLDAPQPLTFGQSRPPDADNEKFILFFSGRRDELIEQDVYPVEHSKLGKFELFLVPAFTRDPEKMDYAVVINRARKGLFKI